MGQDPRLGSLDVGSSLGIGADGGNEMGIQAMTPQLTQVWCEGERVV